jgi:hypothetical protein
MKSFAARLTSFDKPNFVLRTISAVLGFFALAYTQTKTMADHVAGYNAVAVSKTNLAVIDGVTFPEGEHFIVSAIKMYDGANAALLSTDFTEGVLDALTKHGKLTITNNGSIVLKELPLTVFSPNNQDDKGIFSLLKPIVWKGNTALTASITFPTAPTTANQNIRIELIGMKLI